jgi:hypothetical protein
VRVTHLQSVHLKVILVVRHMIVQTLEVQAEVEQQLQLPLQFLYQQEFLLAAQVPLRTSQEVHRLTQVVGVEQVVQI